MGLAVDRSPDRLTRSCRQPPNHPTAGRARPPRIACSPAGGTVGVLPLGQRMGSHPHAHQVIVGHPNTRGIHRVQTPPGQVLAFCRAVGRPEPGYQPGSHLQRCWPPMRMGGHLGQASRLTCRLMPAKSASYARPPPGQMLGRPALLRHPHVPAGQVPQPAVVARRSDAPARGRVTSPGAGSCHLEAEGSHSQAGYRNTRRLRPTPRDRGARPLSRGRP